MQFTSIEVENIFAYGGLSQIDLRGCTTDRNVIVIAGRNGAGKTSLLNAVKLLFLGAENLGIRRVGFGNTGISLKHYVLGAPGRWFGVFNNTARGFDVKARVSLEWLDGTRTFKAQRSFKRANSTLGFVEELTVHVDNVALSPDDAADLISSLAPSEVVPFFLFDGEQVQSFADAEEGRERVEIERLLGLSFLADLVREIESFAKIKSRAGLPDNVKLIIVRAENAHRDAVARMEAANRSRVALEDEILELERKKNRIEDERNGLRTGISDSGKERMLNRISILADQRERLAEEIATQLPPEAPWLTNLDLVHEAFAALDKQLAGGADATLTEKLHRELPQDLIGRMAEQSVPILLSTVQQEEFRLSVGKGLSKYGVPANASINPLLASLSPRQVQVLRDRYLVWHEGGSILASAHAEKLRQIRKLFNEQIQLQRDLDEAELTTDEARHRFEQLTDELKAVEVSLKDQIGAGAQLRIDEQRAERDTANALNDIRRYETAYEEVTRQNRAYQMSLRVKRSLEDYKDSRRTQIRASVERRLNQKISILLAPSRLIKSVTLDDQFRMKYFDERGSEVARRSVSAGMRQLVAMAMLWALKDEANRDLPVMIDTPLGRIDRENRALLMAEYFPNAGNPLVLLPTNTEIGSDGFGQLGDRVRRHYEILNESGEQAKIIEVKPAGNGWSSRQ